MSNLGNAEIYCEIERRIVELVYEPGQLLNEKQLIEEFGVSRTPIREALLKLSEKGFVEMVPRVGTYVSQVDIKKIKYAYEIKKYLEVLAVELAAQRATDDEINEMINIVERIDDYDPVKDYEKYIQDDYLFRNIIREASRNPMLIQYLDELNKKTKRFIKYIQYKMGDSKWYNDSLKTIAYSIKSRNTEEASKEIKKHTEIFLEEISKKFFL